MMKGLQGGKSSTITINVQKELRDRIDHLKDENVEYSSMVLSNFLGHLVGLGVKEAEIEVVERKNKEEARLKAASQAPDRGLNMETVRLDGRIDRLTERIEDIASAVEVKSDEPPPFFEGFDGGGIKRKTVGNS